MLTDKMALAESARYAKIQRLINLLCQKDKNILTILSEDSFNKPFKVGRKITVDGQKITVKNKTYDYYDLQKVTINTEGSMAIHDRSGRKLCGWIELNLSVKNIELFCLWARKYNVPAEVLPGKGERIFQWLIVAVSVVICVLFRIFRKL